MASVALRVAAMVPVAMVSSEQLRAIFTNSEVSQCLGQFGGPEFSYGGGRVHVITQCAKRVEALSEGQNGTAHVGDIVAQAFCVMKSSSDNGVSWDSFQVLTPKGKTSYGGCKGIYDVKRNRLVVQYNYLPSGDSTITDGKRFYQIVSTDDGRSWSAPRDLTAAISGCFDGGSKPRMMAGNRIQTSSGRLIWGGETSGKTCFWYSDDGGDSYSTVWANVGKPNEFSLVEASPGQIYMNGRKGDNCGNNRREYRSSNNGLTWTGSTCSELLDAVNSNSHGCQASLTNVNGKLLFMNPGGGSEGARTHMQVHCSLDGGKTWPAKYSVTSTTDGGYSDLVYLPTKSSNPLLLAFHNADNSNLWTVHIGTAWCKSSQDAIV